MWVEENFWILSPDVPGFAKFLPVLNLNVLSADKCCLVQITDPPLLINAPHGSQLCSARKAELKTAAKDKLS